MRGSCDHRVTGRRLDTADNVWIWMTEFLRVPYNVVARAALPMGFLLDHTSMRIVRKFFSGA